MERNVNILVTRIFKSSAPGAWFSLGTFAMHVILNELIVYIAFYKYLAIISHWFIKLSLL